MQSVPVGKLIERFSRRSRIAKLKLWMWGDNEGFPEDCKVKTCADKYAQNKLGMPRKLFRCKFSHQDDWSNLQTVAKCLIPYLEWVHLRNNSHFTTICTLKTSLELETRNVLSSCSISQIVRTALEKSPFVLWLLNLIILLALEFHLRQYINPDKNYTAREVWNRKIIAAVVYTIRPRIIISFNRFHCDFCREIICRTWSCLPSQHPPSSVMEVNLTLKW